MTRQENIKYLCQTMGESEEFLSSWTDEELQGYVDVVEDMKEIMV